MARKIRSRAIWSALACLCLIQGGPAAGALRGAGVQNSPSGPLTERLAQARAEAKAKGWNAGFWFGFGIRRLMGEHSSMGWSPWGGPEMRLTLDDLINGRKTPLEKKVANEQAVRGTAAAMPDAVRSFASRKLGDEPERPVLRDVAILLRLPATEAPFPADVRVSNLNLPFDFEDLPFVWAGMVPDAESLAFLMPLYAKAASEDDKRSLLWAIGLHRNADTVVPFIERILGGNESEEIRAEAAKCLGEQNEPKALELLAKTIKSDPSEAVREGAVQGLVELELPAAADTLIALALGAADRHIRSEAVRGLGDKATGPAVKALEKISASDKDAGIQKEAIHALAELPRRSGLPYLINLAKTHPDGVVRTEAVEAIGEVGGVEAVKVLTELVKGGKR